MKIAVLGASGYIGQNLIRHLLANTNHSILALSTNTEKIKIENSNLTKINVNVFDAKQIKKYLSDCEIAFYLIHMMGQEHDDFEKAEISAAKSFCKSLNESKVKRVIYLGGLGKDTDKLSKHLLSRHKTGQIIRQSFPQSIEFRASMIIGRGSVSYDIITNLVDKMPVLVLPKLFYTLTQPIGLADTLSYLTLAIKININQSEIVEIGGPNRLSYIELMKRYANWKKKKLFFITLPIVPYGVSAWWLNFFVPKSQAKIGISMVESLANPMLVNNNRAKELFPLIKPKNIEQVFV
jgi:uncharacterized protein YbjT (DUF2867 family)